MKQKLTELKEKQTIHKLETSTPLSQYLVKQADDKHMEKFNFIVVRENIQTHNEISFIPIRINLELKRSDNSKCW